MPNFINGSKELNSCRLCGAEFLKEKLVLKDSPLANELFATKPEAIRADRFPLALVMCSKCKHVQLQDIVDPSRLFASYVYKSGTSRTFQIHFDDLAEAIVEKHGTGVLVLEVGSNDGTLLKSLSERGARAIGIEPSESLCLLSEEMNLNVVHGMLDEQTISIALPNSEKVDVVVANNVFAHIDDIAGALDVISRITREGGSFIFEVAHLQSLIEKSLFDTIYHEHMSYHSVLALEPFLGKGNFKIYDVEKIPTHGGSIRVFARKVSDESKFEASSNVERILEEEINAGLNSPELLVRLRDSISRIRENSSGILSDTEENYVLFGYGAPAKLVTFMNEMDLERLPFVGVVDDNIDKQGKYLPGSGIPIVPNFDLIELAKVSTKPLAVVIFPWNLKDEIVEKLRPFLPAGSRAIWLLPSPEMVTF